MRVLQSISALLLLLAPAHAAEVRVAIAANFTRPAEELGAAFTAATGDSVVLSFGATGQLYTQISQGAPFEVFLSADDKRPAQAVAEGLAVPGSVFTYAVGKLVLYAPGLDLSDGEAVLRAGQFEHLAVADPATAPYGAAALQAIGNLGLTAMLTDKQVVGENITQTLQFVDSGNAELGFVALSQVVDKPAGAIWAVPPELHEPIRQDAALLTTGEHNPVARAFLDFLRSEAGKAIISRYGYEVN